jgi:flagellar motility protein MotE (MotC chaperone)
MLDDYHRVMNKWNMTTKSGLWLAAIALCLVPQAALAEKKPTDHSNQVEKSGSVAFEGHNWSDTSPELTDTDVTMDLGGEDESASAGGHSAEPEVGELPPEEVSAHAESATDETSCTPADGAVESAAHGAEASVEEVAAPKAPAVETAEANGELSAPEAGATSHSAAEPTSDCPTFAEGVPMMFNEHGELVPLSSEVPTSEILAERLSERRATLDSREASLGDREALLQAAEKRLEERSAELDQQVADLQAADKAGDEAENQDLKNLIAMYETMKPSQAAAIFDKLDTTNLQLIAEAMNPRKLAPIMAKMDPAIAAALTIGIAE